MTKEQFEQTPITKGVKAKFNGTLHLVIGINYESGTIRLKGNIENITADFSQIDFHYSLPLSPNRI